MSQTTPHATADAARLEAAGEWLQRLRTEPQSEELLAEWLRWCAEPANQDAFERIRSVWQAIDAPELQSTVERARRSFVRAPARRRGVRRSVWSAGLAAGIVVSAVFAGWQWLERADEATRIFVTAQAENKTELLPDGSRIDLGARSRVEVRYTPARREVTIAAGEAFFTVAKNPARPFVVTAGAVRVTAVGTAFNVRRADGDTVVTVSEGVVKVESASSAPASSASPDAPAPLQAAAGQQVRYLAPVGRLAVASVDPALAASWRDGVLKFVDEPLGSVVAYVNRYSVRQIVIADPILAQRSYTGTVYGGQVDEWLQGLERIYPLKAVGTGAGTVTLIPAPAHRQAAAAGSNS
jgi:transmembrane sensor